MESQVTVHHKGSRRNVLLLNKAPGKGLKEQNASSNQVNNTSRHSDNTRRNQSFRHGNGNRFGRNSEYKHTLFDGDEREMQRREFASREGNSNIGNFDNGFDYLTNGSFSEQDERELQIAAYSKKSELNDAEINGNVAHQSSEASNNEARYSGACQVQSGRAESRKQRCAGLYGINRSRQRRENGNSNFKPRVHNFNHNVTDNTEHKVSDIKECKLSDMGANGNVDYSSFTESFDLSDLAM